MDEDTLPPESISGGSVPDEEGNPAEVAPAPQEPPAPTEMPVPIAEPDTIDRIALFIRKNTQEEKLIKKASLLGPPFLLEKETLDDVTAELLSRESAQTTELKGKKETYYFCHEVMSTNYATMLLLAEEKDIYNTIATMVRFNCKTYPRPTSLESLTYAPVFLDKERAKNAIAVMKKRSEYNDIKTVTASNGAPYYYSEQYMTEIYAQSLAQYEEIDSREYP